MASSETIEIAQNVREKLASPELTEGQAKLYSQSVRRQMGRPGLASFGSHDIAAAIDEAILLIQSALIEKHADATSEWRAGVKRAGELLEWLSQRDLRPENAPLHLLAAAAYQLAGYPALALGHANQLPKDESVSAILRGYVRADFPATLEAVRAFWAEQRRMEREGIDPTSDLSSLAIRHTVMCIGTVCAYLRSGHKDRLERALQKLDDLAAGFLHSQDPYSWILARLTAEISRRYVETSLWPRIDKLIASPEEQSGAALTQFARAAFINRRALVWPAQDRGIDRLCENDSFVLCTPTGSGKTTIATIASIKALFADPPGQHEDSESEEPANLVLYLVPSRALAAEVEARLEQDLHGIAAEPVVVTGLYGGIDWGPTDAWIDRGQPTIVICTFEKADALLRYLGILFLHRVRLVVIDEAHMVDYERGNVQQLEDGASRPYRLELLGTRLLRAREAYDFRLIALSAVAANAAPALARWIAADPSSEPAQSDYRSTRQMLGRLEINRSGAFRIVYDLMDGRSLRFRNGKTYEKPFISTPFPSLPGGFADDSSPDKRMRAPTLWAALHLAARRADGSRPTVLISVTQHVSPFAEACVTLLDTWANQLPDYFPSPQNNDLWTRCLASAADYFSEKSVEYRLLKRGIAVHHGKMPALLARRLKRVIDAGLVKIIIATSTLSEGVNIAVNYLLIPSVFRGTDRFTVQEFNNLIGRAGRPGVGTEGHALVVLPEENESYSRQRPGFNSLVKEIAAATNGNAQASQDNASSSLMTLLSALEDAWQQLTGGDNREDFEAWLAQTDIQDAEDNNAIRQLDALDNFLLSSIEEVEQLRRVDLPPAELEAELVRIWQKTYAHACAKEEARLRSTWLSRGKSLKTLYPDPQERRRIYKSSLTPRSATALMSRSEILRATLQEGSDYAGKNTEQRLEFIANIIEQLSGVPSFYLSTKLGSKRNFSDWQKILRWWLAKDTLIPQPTPKEITPWFEYVAQNFVYRATWGLGSILGLIMNDGGSDPIRPLEINDWPRSGLPWIAFWLKELLAWGTLEPVAAFLLARGDAVDRAQAEAASINYYASLSEEEQFDLNGMLDPRRIRDWVENHRPVPVVQKRSTSLTVAVDLPRQPASYRQQRISVLPIVEEDDQITWVDPAGYAVAKSPMPQNWPLETSLFDFELDITARWVHGQPYLMYSQAGS